MKYQHLLIYAAVIVLAAGHLQACQSTEKKANNSQTEQAANAITEHEQEPTSDTELSLNNGAKWKADSSTNKNVSSLQDIVKLAQPVNLNDYHNTGKALQEGINKMIKECRMQGPNHDALHHWLEPLMEDNKKLLAAATAEEGTLQFAALKQQIAKYNNYFE